MRKREAGVRAYRIAVIAGDGIGREVLEAYTADVNGHFAAYAHHILTECAAVKSQ